jgi:hypothetical protein
MFNVAHNFLSGYRFHFINWQRSLLNENDERSIERNLKLKSILAMIAYERIDSWYHWIALYWNCTARDIQLSVTTTDYRLDEDIYIYMILVPLASQRRVVDDVCVVEVAVGFAFAFVVAVAADVRRLDIRRPAETWRVQSLYSVLGWSVALAVNRRIDNGIGDRRLETRLRHTIPNTIRTHQRSPHRFAQPLHALQLFPLLIQTFKLVSHGTINALGPEPS